MPSRSRGSILLLFALFPLVLVACAGAGQGESRSDIPPDAFMITVQNNDPSLGEATVLLIPETGVQAQLGRVGPGETESFIRTESPGNFRLLARTSGGERRSEQFRVFRGAEATWNMQTNRVTTSNE